MSTWVWVEMGVDQCSQPWKQSGLILGSIVRQGGGGRRLGDLHGTPESKEVPGELQACGFKANFK